MTLLFRSFTCIALLCLALAWPIQAIAQGPGDPSAANEATPPSAESPTPDAGQGTVGGQTGSDPDQPQDNTMGTSHENIFMGEHPVTGDSVIIVTPPPRQEEQDTGLGDINIEVNVDQ